MLRTFIVLLILGLCGFYFYQKQQEEMPPELSAPRTVDESALRALKQSLPAVIFEKDILPAIEQNRKQGLTPGEIDHLLDKLDTIGRALGGNVSAAVEKAAEAIAPDQFPKKSLGEHAADIAGSLIHALGEGLKSCLPALKTMAGELLQALASGISFLLDQTADLIGGK
ncbi:hypothetical protein [Mailhella massiliensis]|uniref:Uncharacterized protein n=1 Tax=Mailhella massiliensis TaxID=1903261 RepID=A0A921DRM7_9BACT|nr:hypothetical protein [Mailhella massiliensis]HJD97804.1 hypothetical protein [Mailhella massiliensis]